MKFPFTLPPVEPGGANPEWTGHNFSVNGKSVPVLSYSSNAEGWSDELTYLHELHAGENHFIDIASRQLALAAILRHQQPTAPITILEVGCSSGYMLKALKNKFPQAMVIGSDVVYQPLVDLSQNLLNTPLFQFDVTQCPLPSNCVDVIVMLNVLEHIENDKLALEQIHRILKPGGLLVLEVPAGPHLYDYYDKALQHFRRYRLADLCKLLTENKLRVEQKSHLGFFIYPAFALVKKLNQRKADLSQEEITHLVANSIKRTKQNLLLKWLIQLELALQKFISFPCGIRAVVLAKKH